MSFKVVMPLDFPGVPYDESVFQQIGATFIKKQCNNEDEIIELARDADAMIGLASTQPLTRKVIEALEKCRFIQSVGIGFDGLDVEAATERGILMANVPDYCLEEVSDHAMALILALGRRLFLLDRACREGKWDSIPRPEIRFKIYPGMQRLRDQTLGLVAFGRISRTLVPKAQGFGLRVITADPYIPAPVVQEMGVELVDLDTLLRESDYVSLHSPLTSETRHLIGAEQLRKMKPTAYLINTARGGIVDEPALIQALRDKVIAGAALDVTDPEPPSIDNPLYKLDNVIITAHSAHYSDTSTVELRKRPGEEIVRVLSGEMPRGLLNPKALEKFTERFGPLR